MTSPTSWSRSAIAVVSEAVWAIRLSTVPPSPCSTLIRLSDSSLMSLGSSAENSGAKPL